MYSIFKSQAAMGARANIFLKTNYSCYCKQWKVRGQLLPCPFSNSPSSIASKRWAAHKYVSAEYIGSYDPNLLSPSTKIDLVLVRNFRMSNVYFESEPLKPSSKVEESVQTLKKKIEDQASDSEVKKVPVKKSLKQKIIDELVHYYHGFRLLFIDINVSRKLIGRILNGKTLSRREHKLLVRTSGDVFRLIPFSVFIIVPFMEFLLPVAIKLFPGMLPSTFETNTEKEDKMRQSLKVKLEMAKFLQQTLDQMAPQSKDHQSDLAKEFSDFFIKIRSSGEQPTNEEIMRFGKLFEDEITLDSLARPQLVALCRVLEVNTIGTSVILRFNLRMKLRSLAADDKMIAKEGVNSMTLGELQQACRARGMRAYGMTEERLKDQLESWLDLSLNEKVPPSLLLLSRALMIPESVPTSDKLKASISILPENIVVAQKAAISEKEGKIDNKAKIEAIKEEERKIQEERIEQREETARLQQESLDKAPVIEAVKTPELVDTAPIILTEGEKVKKDEKKEEGISIKDIEIIEDALDTLGKNKKKLLLEKEELADLKEEMADYQEDVQELREITKLDTSKLKETKGARRLFNKVNSMILKMDTVLTNLEKEKVKQREDKQQHEQKAGEVQTDQADQEELVHIEELMTAIKKIRNVPDDSKIIQIQHILGRLDDDFDGQLKVEDVFKVIETIGKENVNLSQKQVGELIELLDKEEILDVENKIQKALQKEIDQEKLAQDESISIEKKVEPDETVTANENLLKEAERHKVLMEAIEKQKEAILPNIEPDEVKPKPVDAAKKPDSTKTTTKTL